MHEWEICISISTIASANKCLNTLTCNQFKCFVRFVPFFLSFCSFSSSKRFFDCVSNKMRWENTAWPRTIAKRKKSNAKNRRMKNDRKDISFFHFYYSSNREQHTQFATSWRELWSGIFHNLMEQLCQLWFHSFRMIREHLFDETTNDWLIYGIYFDSRIDWVKEEEEE